MLSTKPEDLWQEITQAEQYRKARLEHRNQLIREFHGPKWGGATTATDSSENHAYEYITNVVPRLVFNNPRVNIRTRRNTQAHRWVAEAMHTGMSRWIAQSGLRDMLRQEATDMMMAWGAALLTFDFRPDIVAPSEVGVDEVYWPSVQRLSPDHVFFDPGALSFEQCRFVGHKYRMDLEDLIDEARENDDGTWDLAAVRDLQSSTSDDPASQRRQDDTPDRNEVWLYEVWIPEDPPEKDDELHNGRIHTVAIAAADGKSYSVREPFDYKGPETGPYIIFDAYYVPDHPAPLAPLIATASQAEDLNALTGSVTASAKSYKQFLLTSNSKLAQLVENGQHQWVYNLGEEIRDGTVAPVSVGGIQQEQLVAQAEMRERMNRISGLSEAMRGNTQGESTATAEQIAFQGSSIRVDFLRQAFESSVVQVLTGVAWFMFNSDNFAMGLNVEGAPATEDELWFEGGPTVDVDMSFADLELVIEPYSMERTNDSVRMRRLMDGTNMAMTMGQLMPSMPHVNWKELADDVGDAWNIPDFDSRFNWDVLEQFWAQSGMEALAGNALPAGAPSQMVGRDGPSDLTIRPAGDQSGNQAQSETR